MGVTLLKWEFFTLQKSHFIGKIRDSEHSLFTGRWETDEQYCVRSLSGKNWEVSGLLRKAHHKLGQFSHPLKTQSAKGLLESLRGLPPHQTHTHINLDAWVHTLQTSIQMCDLHPPFVSLNFKDKAIRTTKAQPITEVAIMRKTN